MSRKKIYILAAVVLVLIGGVVYWGVRSAQRAKAPIVTDGTNNENPDAVYFYGDGCSHCKVVAKFLEDNKISEKVNFVKKEVWRDKNNAAEMQRRAVECGIEPSGMGVPFVYSKGKCYVGTPDVEGFFKQAAGIQ